MTLDTDLSALIDDLLGATTDTQPSTGWVKLSDLSEFETQRILTVRPRRRTYLSQAEAGYDWFVGHEFVVTTQSSPYYGSVVAVDEARLLKGYGYTHVHIHYNVNSAPLELEL